MKPVFEISSSSNPKFKLLQSLEKSRVRKTLGLTAIEGEKEIELAMSAGVSIQSLYILKDVASRQLVAMLEKRYPAMETILLTRELFAKISYRETTGGMIALAKTPLKPVSDIVLPENALVLIIEAVEKPGNLGAILRTADAAGVDAVVCCSLPTDIYNPNVIRASLGTVFTVPLALADNQEAMKWIKKNGLKVFCTNLHLAEDYHLEDYTGSTAIVMGTEATGTSDAWIKFADRNIKIPMMGKIDSMNVSVATAIIAYEARRQRLLKRK